MNTLQLITALTSFSAFLVYVFLMWFVLNLNQKELLNKLCALTIASFAVWSFSSIFLRSAYAGRNICVMPTVVFLDLKLPRINGFEVLERIRSDERTKLLPVVILSSSNEEKDLIRSYELGANSYVCKPVDFTEFSNAIRQLGSYWLFLNESPMKENE